MAHGKIYQYAILFHPTEKEVEDEDKSSELIVPLTTILAADESAAIIRASRSIPDKYLEKLHRVEITVRPF